LAGFEGINEILKHHKRVYLNWHFPSLTIKVSREGANFIALRRFKQKAVPSPAHNHTVISHEKFSLSETSISTTELKYQFFSASPAA
jgi:hypothetical protein